MKIEKVLILAMTICCLLIVSSIQIAALEKSDIIEDGKGDVFEIDLYDYSQNFVTENEYIEVDNVDIKKVEYDITNVTLEFSLTVWGEIEDRGSVDQLDGSGEDLDSLNIDTVSYTFQLYTDENTYIINYINKSCQITDDLSENITNLAESDFSINNDILTVTFDLDTTDETFVEVVAQASYTRFILSLDDLDIYGDDENDWSDLGIVSLEDRVPNGPLFIIDAGSDINTAIEDTSVNFIGLAFDGFPPHEYYWEFGDGETSTEQNPSHIYDKPGDYNYTLTVTDAEGAQDSYTGSIEIIEADTEDTPGFEFIIAIMAIGFILLWKKKR